MRDKGGPSIHNPSILLTEHFKNFYSKVVTSVRARGRMKKRDEERRGVQRKNL